MNKKGVSLTATWLVNIILLFFILITFFAFVNRITDDDVHLQEKDVREFALTRDAALASPGKLEAEYRLQPAFDVTVDNNCRVSLKKEGEGAPAAPAQFFCSSSKDQRLSPLKKEEKLASKVVEVSVA